MTRDETRDPNARETAKAEARSRIAAATQELAKGTIDDAGWQRSVTDALADAYLRWDDPRWQSGFDGDARLWREARSLILDAVPRDGTLLDVGCANGHLMESLAAWGRERGRALDVFGLELSEPLADAAKRRLPELADHIFTGNVSDWKPPRRFTYVRTGLEYVPPGGEAALIRRISSEFLEAHGRLIVGPINDSALAETRAAFAAAGILDPRVESASDHSGKTRHVVWAHSFW